MNSCAPPQVVSDENILLPHCDDALELCEEHILRTLGHAGGGAVVGAGGSFRRNQSYYNNAMRTRHKQVSGSYAVLLCSQAHTHLYAHTYAHSLPPPSFQAQEGLAQLLGHSGATAVKSPCKGTGRSPYPSSPRKPGRGTDRAASRGLRGSDDLAPYSSAIRTGGPGAIPEDFPSTTGSGAGWSEAQTSRPLRGLVKILEDYMEINRTAATRSVIRNGLTLLHRHQHACHKPTLSLHR